MSGLTFQKGTTELVLHVLTFLEASFSASYAPSICVVSASLLRWSAKTPRRTKPPPRTEEVHKVPRRGTRRTFEVKSEKQTPPRWCILEEVGKEGPCSGQISMFVFLF